MDARVTVWGENVHEQRDERCAPSTPTACTRRSRPGSRSCSAIASRVRTATLRGAGARPDRGLLAETDVLTWWGHAAHDEVDDAVVARVHERVLGGMGLLALHSAHYSKIFKRLMGTVCSLQLARRGRARAGLDRRTRPSDRRGRAAAS